MAKLMIFIAIAYLDRCFRIKTMTLGLGSKESINLPNIGLVGGFRILFSSNFHHGRCFLRGTQVS